MTYEESTEETTFSPEMESGLFQVVLDRASAAIDALGSAANLDQAFACLPSAAAAAFHLDRFADAKEFAERSISLAAHYQSDWNYGNALHIGHTVLGLLALRDNDIKSAIHHLHASGETPGSPQLGSFGPTMQLAKELLRSGQVAPVMEYLTQCRVFWKMGETWLSLWERVIHEGRVPNFFQHSYV